MPQKPNGFFFYMRTMKTENPAWLYKGYPELSELCSEGWNALDQDEKEVYNSMKNDYEGFVKPKKKKKKAKIQDNTVVDERALDCLGRSIMLQKLSDETDIKDRRAEQREIQELVKQARNAFKEEFYIVHTTNYCITKREPIEYCPAEISIGKFNIKKGFLQEVFHSFIKPDVPLGYKLTIQQNCEEVLKIPFDLDVAKPVNYVVTGLKHAEELILDQRPDPFKAILFCHDDEIEVCKRNIERLIKDEEDVPIFEVYSIVELVMAVLATLNVDVGLTQSACSMMIHHKSRELEYGDGCNWHNANSDAGLCSSSVMRKWCKSIRDIFQPLINRD